MEVKKIQGGNMLIISAVLQAKEGSGDEMEKVIKTFAPRFLQDPSCIEYRPHRRLDNPNVFFFFEKY
jgi:quinol monooxygenase YgiN